MKIAIIDYGAGNVQSVKFALQRLGLEPVLSNNAEVLTSADKVIFPGVGHAFSAMEELKKTNLIGTIKSLKQPTLGVCLGMQLMCSHSEEGDTKGLAIFPEKVVRFQEEKTQKIPHMGWNKLQEMNSTLFNRLEEGEYMYFVHSYYVPKSENTIATSSYSIVFSAALQKDNFYACQFHPEKSGEQGEKILKNFLEL